MRISLPARPQSILLVLAAAMCVALLAVPQSALANQLLLNGTFTQGLKSWQAVDIAKGVSARRDDAGFRDGGSVRFSTTGRDRSGESVIVQTVPVAISPGSKGRVSFAWKKNWSAILPVKQHIYVQLVKPDKNVVTLWANKTLLNDNSWVEQSVDMTPFIDQDGRYALRLGAAFENGSAGDATTSAWFDSVRLELTTTAVQGPKTSLVRPIGTEMLAGSSYSISGTAVDDLGVAGTEVAIIRLADNAYWNGTSWVRAEVWNDARVAAGKGGRVAVWSYIWSLPTSDGARYKIRARSVGITGNREAIPLDNTVQVDNVGPTGTISIEGEATHTNMRDVRVGIDVQGAAEMRFSPDNGRTWMPWERYAAAKRLRLPAGDGTKVVSAQFRDAIDNRYRISDSVVLDATPPVTRHLYPATNAKQILPGASIGVVFYEQIDPVTLKNDGTDRGSTFYMKQGSRWVATDVSYNEKTKTAKLTPVAPLDTGTTYTVYLTTGIADLAGNTLPAQFSWSFTTSGSYKSSFKEKLGPAGGAVEDANQSISLEIPRGALSAETAITIDELRDKQVPKIRGTRYSPVYRMYPQGLPLSNPAILRVKYRPGEAPNPTELRLVYYDEQRQKWLPVPNASIDLVNNQVVAPVTKLLTVTITAQEDSSAPKTTILAPTGAAEIIGRTYTLFGLSSDNTGVARVEVAVVRQSDRAYWNGTDWQPDETWVRAKIVSGKGQPKATWSYRWNVPSDAFAVYEVRARAVDPGGNIESSPDLVQVRLR